jgi:hypothetical protein
LTDTDYGRLLLFKVALFFGMVAIAAVNRLHFTPRLAQVSNAFATRDAVRQLRRNSVIELVIGTIHQKASPRRPESRRLGLHFPLLPPGGGRVSFSALAELTKMM